ncbi:MAG: class I adenylate-forming enzyme family protein [Burkholderiales bacterium]
MIDWHSIETHLLLNPRLGAEERAAFERAASSAALSAHVLIASSGSTGAPRLVALSKEAILASAGAVNRHLGAGRADVWCCVLPAFHVGGLGIHARAYVSGARVVTAAWDASGFARLCEAERVTLSALVPAQVVDLVRAELRGADSLRAIVVGGGALRTDTYRAARELGWPVLPSYGMTECCSQVATATGASPELVILGHLEVREEDGRLAIRGSSTLTGYVDPDGTLVDPKRDGWFLSSDLGEVRGRLLKVSGRVDDLVKIGGELVSLTRLEEVLDSVRGEVDAAVVVASDDRLGSVIHLAIGNVDAEGVVEAFNARVLPFERIRRVHRLGAIPRTALGKVRKDELRRAVAERTKLPE